MFIYLMEEFREDGGLVTGLGGNRNKLEHGNSDQIKGVKKCYESGQILEQVPREAVESPSFKIFKT